MLIKNLILIPKNYFISSARLLSNETCIYAVASGFNQKCGLAVVRLSGKHSFEILTQLTKTNTYQPRKMYLKSIYKPKTNEKIDQGFVVWFKEPNSFTGENVCEFHVHGGPAVLTSLLNALASFKNTKYAEPGEFSKRAFLNGRMDLVEIEGLCDLINAETEMQRRQALDQMEGSLSKLYKDWREKVLKCLAHVEAYIDFSEEENIEDNVLEEVELNVKSLIKSIDNHLNDDRKGERLRNGVRVAIIGEPNSGKSSLINILSKRPVSIVSSMAGTTRDVIENSLNIAGYPIIISDTAGLRNTNELIEIEGIKRAFEKIKTADILIVVVDIKKYLNQIIQYGLNNFIQSHMKEIFDLKLNDIQASLDDWLQTKTIVFSLNKKDLLTKIESDLLNKEIQHSEHLKNILVNKIECKIENDEISELLTSLKNSLEKLCSSTMSEMPALTQQRHRDCLIKCLNYLKEYLSRTNNLNQDRDYALIAEELRQACKWIGVITGHVTTEQIIDVIFRDFCIGK